MKMTAINRVQGVKVLAGKGKGGKTAFSGDVFDVSTEEAERLKDIGAAEEYKVHDPLADAEKTSGETTETKKAPAKKAPAKRTGKKAPAKTADKKDDNTENTGDEKTGDQKADDGSDTASDDDLGLND